MTPDPFQELLDAGEAELETAEMYDGRYERVDVVKGPASGMRFVVLKASLEQDRESIAKLRTSATSKIPNAQQVRKSGAPAGYLYDDGKIFLNGRHIANGTRNASGGWSYSVS